MEPQMSPQISEERDLSTEKLFARLLTITPRQSEPRELIDKLLQRTDDDLRRRVLERIERQIEMGPGVDSCPYCRRPF